MINIATSGEVRSGQVTKTRDEHSIQVSWHVLNIVFLENI